MRAGQRLNRARPRGARLPGSRWPLAMLTLAAWSPHDAKSLRPVSRSGAVRSLGDGRHTAPTQLIVEVTMILGPHPLACILPPDMLERLILNGSQEQRQDALRRWPSTNVRVVRARIALRLDRSAARCRRTSAADAVPHRTILDGHPTRTCAVPGVRPRRGRGCRPATSAVDEAYDGPRRHLRPLLGRLRAQLDRRRGPAAGRLRSTTAGTTTTPSGTASRWCSATATASSSTASPISIDVIGHELTHGVTEDEAQPALRGRSPAR